MRNGLAVFAAVSCCLAWVGAEDAKSTIVININVGTLPVGSSNNEFNFGIGRNGAGVYTPAISYYVAPNYSSSTGPSFDVTADNDFVLNYAFSVSGNGVLNANTHYSYFLDSRYTNPSISITKGSSVISSNFLINDVPVQAGAAYTLSMKFHYVANTYSLPSGISQGLAQIPLDVAIAQVSPAPEPAIWAMMIGGFGLVGAAMRRRRIASVYG